MSKLTDRVSYLKGLAEGMKLNPEKDANRLITEMLEVMGEMARDMEQTSDDLDELCDYVECIDEDLSDLEDNIYDDGEETGWSEDDEEDEDGEDGDDEDDNLPISYTCPHCGEVTEFLARDIDLSEDMPCPHCGKPLFPEFDVSMEAGDTSDEEDDSL